MSTDQRIEFDSSKEPENIGFLATLPDKKLVERLELIELQSILAVQQDKISSARLLEVWRSQIIAARIYKAEHAVPDTPGEIERVAAQVEVFRTEADNRAETFIEEQTKKAPEKEINDNFIQLSMFD
jgi:hypothetical protein